MARVHSSVTWPHHASLMRFATLVAASLVLAACTSAAETQQPTGSATPATSRSDVPSAATSPSAGPSASGWTKVSDGGGPSARADHTLTIDGDGAKAYLFGGHGANGSLLGDLWQLDLAAMTWHALPATGPAPRFGHNAAWVEDVGLVVFAGQGATFYNDLWAYDPDNGKWRRLPAAGDVPVARYGSCAALGPDGRLWISHGFTSEGSRFADTRAYDFEARSWTDETPAGERPVERCLHACWWTDDGRLALYAGQTTGRPALGDLWHLSQGIRPGTNAWSKNPAPSGVRPRQLYASARWGAATIVFGGGAQDGSYLADTWLIRDRGGARRIEVDAGPSGRAGAELIADPLRDRVLLFGGMGAAGVDAQLWMLTLPER